MLDWLNTFVQCKKADGTLAGIYTNWMKGQLPTLLEEMGGIAFTHTPAALNWPSSLLGP